MFFGVAAAWFVAMALTDTSGVRHRLVNGHSGHSHRHVAHGSGMHTSSTIDASMELSPKVNEPAWIATINGIAACMAAGAAIMFGVMV